MKQAAFRSSRHVQDFVDWLISAESSFTSPKRTAPSSKTLAMPICLRIPKSRFVPGAISANVHGFEAVLQNYRWKATGMRRGDWRETYVVLSRFRSSLAAAISRANHVAALTACTRILQWGGDRNPRVGAGSFLHSLSRQLTRYLQSVSAAMRLSTADTAAMHRSIRQMNSMLSKVHAMAASDGLPIYDSRVAAAIASLVEMWRVAKGITTPLPSELTFPATSALRTVRLLYPNAVHVPPALNYMSPARHAEWAGAMIRLGWLLQEVLARQPSLFGDARLYGGVTPTLADRMHAFEAALFMIGYDVRCLTCTAGKPVSASVAKRLSKTSFALNDVGYKIARTKTGRGNPIKYKGNIDTLMHVTWGRSTFQLDAEFFADLMAEFAGRKGVPLGANMTGRPVPGSLGEWLATGGRPLTRRHASAVAPILVAEGLTTFGASGRRMLIDF